MKPESKAAALRKLTKADLERSLEDLRQELFSMRCSKNAQANDEFKSQIQVIKKDIARIHTVMNQMRLMHFKELYEGKQYVPRDLRPKLTKAARTRLSDEQLRYKARKYFRGRRAPKLRLYAVKGRE